MIIDLHTHSTASDGTDEPGELVRKAARAGVDVLGLTDHDTTAGWAAASLAMPAGLTLVTGAEFSCVWTDGTVRISLHLLGYLFDPEDAALRAEQARLRASRVARGHAIVDRMQADGLPVDWGRVEELAAGGAVGRPHIARVLVERGVVASVDEAFRRLLHSSSPYYVPKADTDVFVAIALVLGARGVPVFAHPRARRRGRIVSDEVIVEMSDAGLAGIEVDHPDQDAADRAELRTLAAQLGLVPTGASDYHGSNKRTPLGAETTAPDAYARLLARNTARSPLVLSV